ncbi:MAG TPA: leucine zipper domain-containing protein, partial [Silvibacterium sp.]|nr:leucine zipper domain-containing protein [Silvibacterium sp.]
MDYHKNAPWTAVSRERLARMVIEDGIRLGSAASRFSVSVKTAAKWAGRYRQSGPAGLVDRSSRPRRSPRQISSLLVEKVLALRRRHMPGYQIARRNGQPTRRIQGGSGRAKHDAVG